MLTYQIKTLILTTFFFSSFVLAEPNICLTDFQEKLSKDSIEKIKMMRYETESCVYCEASASLLSSQITKFTIDELKKDSNYFKNIIKKKEIIIPARYKIFKNLIKIKNLNRINCIMLPFSALFKALKI